MKRAIVGNRPDVGSALADEVHLKGGGRLTGEIVEQTAENITVDIGAGRMTVQMSTVVRIDKSASPLQEYRTARRHPHRPGCRGLAGAGALGGEPGARDAVPRGLHARDGAHPRGSRGQPRPRPRAAGRPVDDRGRELSRPRLRQVPGRVDDAGREAGDPRGAPGERGGRSPGARRPDAGRPGGGAGTGGPGGRRSRTTSGTTPCPSSANPSTGGATATRRRSGPCNRSSNQDRHDRPVCRQGGCDEAPAENDG